MTITGRTMKAAITAITICAFTGVARADTASLACASLAKRYEAKLLFCAARCHASAEAGDDIACRNRCETSYDHVVAARRCDNESRSATTVTGNALVQQARLELAHARLLRCSARCDEPRASDTCSDRCTRRYAGEVRELSNRGLAELGVEAPSF